MAESPAIGMIHNINRGGIGEGLGRGIGGGVGRPGGFLLDKSPFQGLNLGENQHTIPLQPPPPPPPPRSLPYPFHFHSRSKE